MKMPSDDFRAVAYRILRYIDACQKAGVQPDADQLISKVAGVPYSYYVSVMKDLADSGYITGVSVRDYIDGTSGVFLDNVRLTLAGADFLAESSSMRKASKAAGAAFEAALSALVASLMQR